MAERIEKRLRRYKRRLKDRSASANGREPALEIPSYVIAAPDEDFEEVEVEGAGDNPVIVAESTKSLHVMTVGDAVAELDLTGAPVVMFRHAGHGRMNVVYRRPRRQHRLDRSSRVAVIGPATFRAGPNLDPVACQDTRHGTCMDWRMTLIDLLSPAAVISPLRANGKKQALLELAQQAAQLTGLSERDLFEALLQRERLGSTGIGDGIAIPHGRMAGIDRLVGLFARAEKPIDFDALDGQPVDLIFVLIAPEGAGADHLKALARVARVLRNPAVLEQVRAARDPAAIYAILSESAAQAA